MLNSLFNSLIISILTRLTTIYVRYDYQGTETVYITYYQCIE